jgi:hypothetical protein
MATKRLGAALAIIAAIGLSTGAARAAFVQVNDLVLRADGGFTPRHLPRKSFAPIHFQGHADLKRVGGGIPPALTQAVIQFDRDGRLRTGSLPQCTAEAVANATPAQARETCRGAIVGMGHVEALVAVPGLAVMTARSPLTVFNGPRQDGHPTAVVHAQMTEPALQTFAVPVSIEPRHGAFRYRVTFDVPPVAGGYGALTHVDLKVGRRWRVGGKPRSYVAARCSDGVLQTRGRFSFDDGTIIDGSVFKGCSVRR